MRRPRTPRIVLLCAALSVGGAVTASAAGHAAPSSSQPPELGSVRFRRGYDAARAEASRTQRPVLVLFDELPGCSTVLAFGKDVLTHPLIVEAMETLFVPVVVHNNSSGDDDARVLAAFGEPRWNNPVLRFVTATGAPLGPRVDGDDRSVGGVARAMVLALQDAKRPVPSWLSLLALQGVETQQSTYAMGCFWEGEVALGSAAGVVATEPGFVEGREVVRVTHTRAAAADVAAAAAQAGYRPIEGTFRPAPATDDKRQLQGRAPPGLTPAQRTQLNSRVGRGLGAGDVVSPRQAAAAQP